MKKFLGAMGWLVIIIAFFVIKGMFTSDDTELKANNTNDNIEINENENNDNESNDEEVEEVVQEVAEVTKIDEIYHFAEFTIEVIESSVKDGKTTVNFKWINQAGDGKKRLMGLALLTATQNGEELKDIEDKWKSDSNASPFYIENAQNGALLFDLTYDTADPFEISIRGLADGQKEVIKIN